MLPFQVRVDLGAMAMKRYSIFSKDPKLESGHQIVECHIQKNCWWSGCTPQQKCSKCSQMSIQQGCRWFEKFCSGYKNINIQARSCWLKTEDSEVVLQAVEVNPVISTQNKSSCQIVLHISKILQNF